MADAAAVPRSEFTIRGVLLGIAITLVFTAAQVYLGLKVGLTFATSIPAAVISMALLRAFKTSTIQENNIVQTIASAAGTLASVIFVLPGLLMIGWWAHVPFFTTFMACAVGGILGVMYTIPLRRALVTNSNLPYPEGVAAAEVLKVGTGSREGAAEGKAGLIAVAAGTLASALFAALAAAKIFAGEVAGYFKAGAGATGLGASSSLALMGAGHLMGITVGIAMFTGLAIAWAVLVPIMTQVFPMPSASAADHALTVWSTKVRFLGAGVIGAAAIWTLGKLIVPIWQGLVSALEAGKTRRVDGAVIPRVEQDIPILIVGIVATALLAPAGWVMAHFLSGGPLSAIATPLIVAAVAFLVFAGLLAAAVCGYMAGLIGSSNSPVSGIAILTVLGASLMVGAIGRTTIGPDVTTALVAFALFVTAIVLAVAVVANDNLQDLKTGQLVDATPWKQQVALVIGVLAGSLVIPVMLELLNRSNGFTGAPNLSTVVGAENLGAPQATLISTLAKGVMGGVLPWNLLGIGAAIGLGLVLVDILVRRFSAQRFSLPPLGVGLAIYLPSAVTAPVVVGAVIGWFYERIVSKDRTAAPAKRMGVLVASGFIVGESLFNVALAGLIVGTNKPTPLAVPFAPSEHVGMILALIAAAIVVFSLYSWARKAAARTEQA
ncbi:OPT family oligopeptide transporter [Caulobacter sp. DWR1-3-2b1]|uniref:OPT family oligopeptide transporter n=1 Tax=Caulobacter sp. DWR1-3-2b1 TaxID=2804670 RepID=UPI003CEB1414